MLGAAFAVVHLIAGAIVVPLEIDLSAKIAIVALILASLGLSIGQYAILRLERSVIALEVRDRESASFQTRDGAWRDARVLGTTYVTPALTVLNLRAADERLARHVLLVAYNTDAEDFRQLRVVLRWCQCRGGSGDGDQTEAGQPFADKAVPF